MATKLGEMLVEAGRLTLLQLEEALKNQAVFGGKLGTNLIELGFLEEEEVAEFLKVVVPFLERWRVLPPPFEAWQEEARENFREQVRTNLSVPGLVFSNLKPLDALFFLLGATAAFRIGRGRVLPDIRRGPGGRTTPGGLPRRTQGAPGGIEIRPPVVRKQGIVFRRRKEPPPPEGGDVRN